MSAYHLLYEKYKERGWNEETKLQLCMEFIDMMDVHGVFKEFLQKTVEEEYWNSLEPFEKGEMIRSSHLAYGKSYDEEDIG
jgi:hypothetical protein